MNDNKLKKTNDNIQKYLSNTILTNNLMKKQDSKTIKESIKELMEDIIEEESLEEIISKIVSKPLSVPRVESAPRVESVPRVESAPRVETIDNNSLITNLTIDSLKLDDKNKSTDINYILNNKIIIDIAILCQEYTGIDVTCKDNIINLDEIEVTKEIFQSIFYPYHDNFGINKDFIYNNKQILPYISIHPDFRTYNKKRFFLLEELIANIERDLNVSRNCFTKESIIELTNEISGIKTLCDINCCSVLSSLSWSNILEIINNYKLVKSCLCNYNCQCPKYNAIPICVLNIIFKTPTCGVKNTVIRLHYKITNL